MTIREILNVLPSNWVPAFVAAGIGSEATARNHADRVNLQLRYMKGLSHPVPGYIVLSVLRGFYLPALDLVSFYDEGVDNLALILYPSTVEVQPAQVPHFLPYDFSFYLEGEFGGDDQLNLREALCDALLLTDYDPQRPDFELIIFEYGNVMNEYGVAPSKWFDILVEMREIAIPVEEFEDIDVSGSIRARIVQFLLTPFNQAAKLPKNITDDIATYFGKAKEKDFEVSLPGWDEIIRFSPGTPITPGEKSAWRKWRRAAKDAGMGHMGFDMNKIQAATLAIGPPPLDSAQINHMRVRWEIAKRINVSPTPDSIQTIGNILTWFDDIQDALVTLAYLSRVGTAMLSRVVPRVALKATRVLSWVVVAKDLMDIMHYVRALRLARSDKKRAFFDALELIPRSKLRSVKLANKIRQLLPSFRETIQIAQTTDVVFGTGLALGPIVGAIEDIYFGMFTGAKYHFLGQEFNFPDYLFPFPFLLHFLIKSPNVTTASFQAFRIINKASRVLPHINQLPVDCVLNVLTALHYAWAYMAMSGDLRDFEDWQHKTMNIEIKTRPLNEETKEILSQLEGYTVHDNEPFSSPTHQHTTTPYLLAGHIQKTFVTELNTFMENHKHQAFCQYICTLINEITINYLTAINGTDPEIKDTLVPFASAIMLVFHYALDEKLPPGPEDQEALISKIATMIILNFGKWPSYTEILSVFPSEAGSS